MTSAIPGLEALQAHLTAISNAFTAALTAHGLPPTLAPLILTVAAILGGLALVLMLLSWLSASVANEGLRPDPDTTGRGATPRNTRTPLLRRGGAGTPRDDTTTPRDGGRRIGGEGDDWAADEPAVLERAGGKEPPPRGWLVPDLVPHGPVPVWQFHWRRPTREKPLIDREVKGYTTVVIGSGGTGKSYVLADLATAALTGGTWLGKPVQRVKRVLYVDCELDAQTFWTRTYAVARGRWLEGGSPPKGLHYLRLYASLASWSGQQQIRQAVRKSRADLILVDSLTIGAYGLALADQNGWRRVYAGFERWGKPVVAIDHLGKEAGKGAVGSFMKQAMVRSALTMERERGGNIKVEHSKTNFGPQVETFRVVASFEGGTEETGPLTVSFTALDAGPQPIPATVPPKPFPTSPQSPPLRPSPIPSPIPLPILTPPAAPGESIFQSIPPPVLATDSPILAWMRGPSGTTDVVPSRVVYAAMGLQGMTLRACKVELKRLAEAGQLERSGSAQKGYSYRVAGREPADAGVEAAG